MRVICGPTAAGKTQAAMLLARRESIAVVSADSRQLYRRFDAGTAKPTAEERRAVPHYGVDVLDPTERASAAWWAARADDWFCHALASGRTPLVVGGTGLYLRALFGSLFEEPPLDPERRLALQTELGALPIAELRRWVERLDPARAHLGPTQLLRAAEIALLTGRRVSELHQERRTTPRWRARYLVVDRGMALAAAIESRTRQMIEDGWIDEVRRLAVDVPAEAPAWNATGYRTIRGVAEARITETDAQTRVVIETRQYAKRQRTWFRHQLHGEDVTFLDVTQPDGEARLFEWWNGSAA